MDNDRYNLLTMKLSLNKFTELLCEKLEKITSHSFTAKSQANYHKHLKEILSPDETIVLGDFAENYTFRVHEKATIGARCNAPLIQFSLVT